ncbi:MAG TPA: hypothetical protein VF139_05280 [Candidatus Polarisedimenticolaceae bacterium]
MKTITGILLGALALAGTSLPAASQTASDIALTRAEIQTARQALVAEGLNLTEEEALAFWPVYRDYRVEMARLGDRLVKVITEFVPNAEKLTDEQATRLLDEFLDLKGDEVSLKKKYVGVFRKLLPAPKVTRFFQLENKLDAVIQYELAATVPLAR